MTPDRPVCGHPVTFYALNRPRTDYAPVCFRPLHEGERHMSRASWEQSVLHQREIKARRRDQLRMSGPADSVPA